MNKETYKCVDGAFNTVKFINLPNAFKLKEMEEVAENARAAWDEKSDHWQESEKGQEENALIEHLERALEEIKAADKALQQAQEELVAIMNDAPEGSFKE
jgi:hypothetical protein